MNIYDSDLACFVMSFIILKITNGLSEYERSREILKSGAKK